MVELMQWKGKGKFPAFGISGLSLPNNWIHFSRLWNNTNCRWVFLQFWGNRSGRYQRREGKLEWLFSKVKELKSVSGKDLGRRLQRCKRTLAGFDFFFFFFFFSSFFFLFFLIKTLKLIFSSISTDHKEQRKPPDWKKWRKTDGIFIFAWSVLDCRIEGGSEKSHPE